MWGQKGSNEENENFQRSISQLFWCSESKKIRGQSWNIWWMLFLFRSAPEVKKRIHSKLFRKFWEEPGYKRANLHYCTCLIYSLDDLSAKLRTAAPIAGVWPSLVPPIIAMSHTMSYYDHSYSSSRPLALSLFHFSVLHVSSIEIVSYSDILGSVDKASKGHWGF